MLVVPNLEGLLPTPLLPPEELEKERHGNEENIDGWLKSFVSICIKGGRSVWIAKKRIYPRLK